MIQGISILFIAAAIQGVFLAVTLGVHRKNIQANQILAVWIAILSVDLLQQAYYFEAYYQSYPQFIILINLLPLTYGSFLFLYVRGLLTGQKLTIKDAIHFLFLILAILLQIPLSILSPQEKLELIMEVRLGNLPWQIKIFSLLLPLIASIYAVMSYRLFLKHPAAVSAKLSWLKFMLHLNMGIWLVVWISILLPQNSQILSTTIIYLLVSFVIYAIGYFSLRQPEIFKGDFSIEQTQNKETAPKYGENRLPDELRESIWKEIENYMQLQSPWRSTNLTLSQLSNDMGIASHHISQVLNDHLGLSFNDYLNQYRVKAVCAELVDSELNLLNIALACGFSSKSSFNSIFKKHTGKTPSEYRKSL